MPIAALGRPLSYFRSCYSVALGRICRRLDVRMLRRMLECRRREYRAGCAKRVEPAGSADGLRGAVVGIWQRPRLWSDVRWCGFSVIAQVAISGKQLSMAAAWANDQKQSPPRQRIRDSDCFLYAVFLFMRLSIGHPFSFSLLYLLCSLCYAVKNI